MVPHSSLQWAVHKVNNVIKLQSVQSTLCFEIARHPLPNFKVPAKSTRIQRLTPSSEKMFRFDYTIPNPLAKELLGRVMNHPLWTMGNVSATNGADLAREIMFNITPSKAFQRACPDFQQVDMRRAILTSEAARQCGVLGAIPRTYNEFYVCMTNNHMPVMPNKHSLTAMSFMLFQEDNLVIYRSTTGAMISSGGYASWRAKHPDQKIDLSIIPRHRCPQILAARLLHMSQSQIQETQC